jgi:putative addiction module component (TIGR02574 family)
MKSFKETQEDLDSFEAILRAALELSPDARAALTNILLESLTTPAPNQAEIDAAWAAEIERRLREIDEETVELIPGDQVIAELRSRFKQ